MKRRVLFDAEKLVTISRENKTAKSGAMNRKLNVVADPFRIGVLFDQIPVILLVYILLLLTVLTLSTLELNSF